MRISPPDKDAPSDRTNRRIDVRTLLPLSIPVALGGLIAFAPIHPVSALPAFADQTGLACSACHVGGYGPQLTPFGRNFKLNGYTQRSKAAIPISAMTNFSYTHTNTDQVPAPDNLSENDNVTLDEASIFLAGGIGQHFGGFAQITYDGVGKEWAWDNVDLRAVTKGKLFGADAVFGLTLNNSPTVQDAWNTTPVWGFPYTETATSGTPDAAPLIGDALAQDTIGLSAYAWVNQSVYAEVGAYTSPSAGTVSWLGADPYDPGNINGLAPYGRLAWQGMAGGGTLELGAFGLKAALNPERDTTSGFTDHYSDVGLDASWQKQTASGDVISIQGRYIHESKNLEASCQLGLIGAGGSPDCANVGLNEIRGDIGYHWHNKLGATISGFSITGDSNANLYDGPAASPDSDGVALQLDYAPWANGNGPLGNRVNLQLGLQYTAYGKFNGASQNYDGAGANASDNNVLRIYTWLAY